MHKDGLGTLSLKSKATDSEDAVSENVLKKYDKKIGKPYFNKEICRGLDFMRQTWPAISTMNPLAIGSGEVVISKMVKSGFSKTTAQKCLKRHATSKEYRARIAMGFDRLNLDGTFAEKTSLEHRKDAYQKIGGYRGREKEDVR